MSDIILSVRGITKLFPGVTALDDVSFDIVRGHIHAVVGENGAGKSTLIKILSGVYAQTSGTFLFNGKEVVVNRPLDAQRLGISVVHQELKLVDSLSVMENIFLGRPRCNKAGLVDWKQMRIQARELLNRLKVTLDPEQPVSTLSVAQKQIVEICKALSYDSEVIIMDEPSATLTEKELDILFGILHTLRQEGITIIYISHRLEEIFRFTDMVSVFRDGKHIKTLPTGEVKMNELIHMMVGRELGQEFPEPVEKLGEYALEARNINRGNLLKDISLSLREGEILGIAGLVGSGRTELARAIFGADKGVTGEVYIKGVKAGINKVSDAIRVRIALVPEDRKRDGLVLGMPVSHNISLANMGSVTKNRMLNPKKEFELAWKYIDLLRIITPDESRQTLNLSGGNQQKVVLAKWLNSDASVLIVDEPTRGIDVGAKAEIYRILRELAGQGKAIMMISSEMPELIGICNRIVVMHDGRITGELQRSEFSQERIMELAIS